MLDVALPCRVRVASAQSAYRYMTQRCICDRSDYSDYATLFVFTSVILIELILILLHAINKNGMRDRGGGAEEEKINNLHLGCK